MPLSPYNHFKIKVLYPCLYHRIITSKLPGTCSIEIQCLKHLTCNHQTVNKIPSLSILIKGIPLDAHMPCLNHSEEEDNVLSLYSVSLPSRSLRLACWSCLLPGKQALLPSKTSLFIA